MNKYALCHRSDSLYAFALAPDWVEIRLRAARGDIKKAELIYGVKHAFSKSRKTALMRCALSDGLYDYFTIRLRLDDRRLAYVFRLCDGEGNSCYFSESGASESYDFSKSYYDFFQFAYVNPADVTEKVKWLSEAVVYQIFVDRFYASGERGGHVNMEWGDKPTPKSFAGGNLDGIREKLDYIADLGVNTIYLTPIFTSPSNHKYDTVDYYNVDPRFGGNEAFSRLVKACKERGIRVILDAVFNHASEDMAEFRDVREKGRASRYHDWFIIHGDKPTKRPLNYEVFADCDYMPKWNTNDPEVQEHLCRIGEYWIQKYGIDGWRLDVSDEISHDFWRVFRRRMKALSSSVALIGENWHDARPYLRGDQFDSIMNYSFTKAMTDYFCAGVLDEKRLCDVLGGIIMRNTTQVNGMMLNLLDSHDTHRFYTLCGRDEKKLLAALAVNLFMPGATMLYYGTEIPLEGGYDPDSRRCFIWGEHPFTAKVKDLLRYKKLRALVEGDVSFSHENGLFIVERIADGQKATLIVNNSTKASSARGKTVSAGGFEILVE